MNLSVHECEDGVEPGTREACSTCNPQPVPVVNYEPGSRLEQLHAEYIAAKAAESDAKKRATAATDALKLELTQAAPEQPKIELAGSAGPRLHLGYVETWRFDSTRLKKDDPVTYVRYAKKSGSWVLRQAKGGE